MNSEMFSFCLLGVALCFTTAAAEKGNVCSKLPSDTKLKDTEGRWFYCSTTKMTDENFCYIDIKYSDGNKEEHNRTFVNTKTKQPGFHFYSVNRKGQAGRDTPEEKSSTSIIAATDDLKCKALMKCSDDGAVFNLYFCRERADCENENRKKFFEEQTSKLPEGANTKVEPFSKEGCSA